MQAAERLMKSAPSSTAAAELAVPMARSALLANGGDFGAALEALEPTRRFEMGQFAEFWATYLRATAYLGQGPAREAMADFQKVVDRRSVVPASVLYPLWHLGLARAAAAAASGIEAAARTKSSSGCGRMLTLISRCSARRERSTRSSRGDEKGDCPRFTLFVKRGQSPFSS